MIGEFFGLRMLALRTKFVFGRKAISLIIIIDYDKDVTQQIYRFEGDLEDRCLPEEPINDKVYGNIIRRLFDKRKDDLGASKIHLCALKWDLVKCKTEQVKIKFEMPDGSLWIFENINDTITIRPSLISLS